MQVCVIVNENAGTAEQSDVLSRSIDRYDNVTCWTSAEPGAGIEAAQQAAEEGFDCVVAAGGDGTINEVVNGLMRSGKDVGLGIVPLGTGNDLARTLAIPTDPSDALAVIQNAAWEKLDLFQVRTKGQVRWGVNASAGGFSGQVDESLTPEVKKSWGPLAYLLGAASVLPEMRDYKTHIQLDDGSGREVNALNIIVANGRTVGGGRPVAPHANPCDGLLDVTVVRWGSLVEIAEVGARLLAGNYVESDRVEYYRARTIAVSSFPGMWFNVDGDLFTQESVEFTVRPGAIRVTCGPKFQPEPDLAFGRWEAG